MSIRSCDWPGCPSRHPVGIAPSTPGWLAFGVTAKKIILCPFHSTGEHRPRLILLTPSPTPLRAECTCGWSGGIEQAVGASVLDWQGHIEFVQRAQAG